MSASEPAAAASFRRLHADGLLLLANVWDAGSARLIESLGAKALATTSAGLAWSHGYADGDLLPVRLLVAAVGAIARGARVPLTVDVEGGYAQEPGLVGEVVGAWPRPEELHRTLLGVQGAHRIGHQVVGDVAVGEDDEAVVAEAAVLGRS